MLNAETKTLSKGFSNKLKAALSTVIYSQQTAYVKNRFLGESFTAVYPASLNDKQFPLCSQCLVNIEGFLVTVDIRKAFNSLNHDFLSYALRKFRFGKTFIIGIEILLKQLMCSKWWKNYPIFKVRKRHWRR